MNNSTGSIIPDWYAKSEAEHPCPSCPSPNYGAICGVVFSGTLAGGIIILALTRFLGKRRDENLGLLWWCMCGLLFGSGIALLRLGFYYDATELSSFLNFVFGCALLTGSVYKAVERVADKKP